VDDNDPVWWQQSSSSRTERHAATEIGGRDDGPVGACCRKSQPIRAGWEKVALAWNIDSIDLDSFSNGLDEEMGRQFRSQHSSFQSRNNHQPRKSSHDFQQNTALETDVPNGIGCDRPVLERYSIHHHNKSAAEQKGPKLVPPPPAAAANKRREASVLTKNTRNEERY